MIWTNHSVVSRKHKPEQILCYSAVRGNIITSAKVEILEGHGHLEFIEAVVAICLVNIVSDMRGWNCTLNNQSDRF